MAIDFPPRPVTFWCYVRLDSVILGGGTGLLRPGLHPLEHQAITICTFKQNQAEILSLKASC